MKKNLIINGTVTISLEELDKLRNFREQIKKNEGGFFRWQVYDLYESTENEYWFCQDAETKSEIERLKAEVKKIGERSFKMEMQLREIATSRKARKQWLKNNT